ncbi:recombinase family protein [Kiloniella laminariae]|uniref:Recombinase family protein n=1 Tax=Kiloniella laminariae TaxID=454162 RepID=A0ABT4LHH0_9PROT|nr:recombinase family protein [Kiloniella laminariae]MCZ4279811.1 recombinase family protein [Kiloniella laminariae]
MKIGYARVSAEGQNLAQQVAALEEAGCEQVFQEVIGSNRVVRPALDQALALAQAGDTLVVWRLDRLGRRTVELIDFIRRLEARAIDFQSLTEGINTATPLGKMVYSFIAALAENERDLAIERSLKAGKPTKQSKANGQGKKAGS